MRQFRSESGDDFGSGVGIAMNLKSDADIVGEFSPSNEISDAYRLSMKKASVNRVISEEFDNESNCRDAEIFHKRSDANSFLVGEERGEIGIKTLLCAGILFFGGLAIFITGCVVFFTSSGKNDRNAKGKDILICGAIMLIPGSYAAVIIYGAWKKWPGYHFHLLPSFQ